MRQIPLTQGRFALVDDADFDRVNQFKWHALKGRNTWYAVRSVPGATIYLHNFLLGLKGVDHRDGDGLNDQRENLRPASAQQNSQASRRKRVNASSRFRGVHLQPERDRWKSEIKVAGFCLFLGRFVSEVDAARAYDAAAKEHFGDFAQLNFPSGSSYRQRPSHRAMLSIALSHQL